ncbi:MAG TPA: alpha/beta fold hydrolase [Opitutaceae bacterium]|nr:alpha/beta fold hydrolase [Opitutaceae bacterium]
MSPARAQPSAPPDVHAKADDLRGDTVVLLHGLGLGSWAMKRFETALRRDGCQVINLSYASRTVPLEELAATWLPPVLRERGAESAPRLHFVTHSMGGILLRLYLRDHAPANFGRAVMLAPPNAGSEVIDHLARVSLLRRIWSVNGARLGTGTNSVPRALGPWPGTGPLGIIAGNRSFNPLFSSWLPFPSDGKVSVASARLEGMTDFLVLPHSHTWLQWRGDTIAQTRTFLRTGRFDPIRAPTTHGVDSL